MSDKQIRSELFSGGSTDSNGSPNTCSDYRAVDENGIISDNTIDGKMRNIEQLQQSGTTSLQSSLRTINTSIQLGNKTSVQLNSQKETLIKIGEELSDVDSTVGRARVVIKKIKKNQVIDMCIVAAVIVVISLIIAVGVYQSRVNSDSN